MEIVGPLILQIILIALNAIFACAEIAVISINEIRIEQQAEDGDRKAAKLLKFLKEPARFLATIQVAITLSGFLGSAFAADNFSDPLVDWLVGSVGVPIPVDTLNTIAVVVITIILSYFTLVLGELVPKRLAMNNPEKLSRAMAGMLRFVQVLFTPIVWVLTASTNGLLRLLGQNPNATDDQITEEEIRTMVDAGQKKGVIQSEKSDIIQNVFEFDDISVSEFLTHRTKVDILWTEDSLADWEEIFHATRHSIYPVCGDCADHVLGILNVKDYYRMQDRTKETVLAQALRPAYFVPASLKADVLFRRMQQSRCHFAVVLDEYGGMDGIVTMNDLLEQLVGDLADSDEEPEIPDIRRGEGGRWMISGEAPLEEVNQALGIELPEEEYETFGGYVFDRYGSIPEDGSRFTIRTDGLQIRAELIQGHRLEQAVVRVLPQEEGSDEAKKSESKKESKKKEE